VRVLSLGQACFRDALLRLREFWGLVLELEWTRCEFGGWDVFFRLGCLGWDRLVGVSWVVCHGFGFCGWVGASGGVRFGGCSLGFVYYFCLDIFV